MTTRTATASAAAERQSAAARYGGSVSGGRSGSPSYQSPPVVTSSIVPPVMGQWLLMTPPSVSVRAVADPTAPVILTLPVERGSVLKQYGPMLRYTAPGRVIHYIRSHPSHKHFAAVEEFVLETGEHLQYARSCDTQPPGKLVLTVPTISGSLRGDPEQAHSCCSGDVSLPQRNRSLAELNHHMLRRLPVIQDTSQAKEEAAASGGLGVPSQPHWHFTWKKNKNWCSGDPYDRNLCAQCSDVNYVRHELADGDGDDTCFFLLNCLRFVPPIGKATVVFEWMIKCHQLSLSNAMVKTLQLPPLDMSACWPFGMDPARYRMMALEIEYRKAVRREIFLVLDDRMNMQGGTPSAPAVGPPPQQTMHDRGNPLAASCIQLTVK